MKLLQLAKRTFIEVKAVRTANYAVCLRSLGFCMGELGDLVEAMEFYREAKEVFEATSSTKTPNYAGLLADMGRIKLTEMDLEHAMECPVDMLSCFWCILVDFHGFYDVLHRFMFCLSSLAIHLT